MTFILERPTRIIDGRVADSINRSSLTTTDKGEMGTAPISHLNFHVGEEARLVSGCSKGRAPPSTQSVSTLMEYAQSFRRGTSHDCSGDDNGNYDDCNVEWSGEEAHHSGNFQRRDIDLYCIVRDKLDLNDIMLLYASISTTIIYLLCAAGFFASLIVRVGCCALLKIGSKIEPTGRSVSKRVEKLLRLCKCLLGLSVLVSLVAAEEVSGGISVAEEGRKLEVALSGSNTGQCAVDGNCFSSLNYANYESCTFTMSKGGVLDVISFNTEYGWDFLYVDGTSYDGSFGPDGVSVSAGDEIVWMSGEMRDEIMSKSEAKEGSDNFCIACHTILINYHPFTLCFSHA
jgi:hypothetical protein